ncbi:MAG: Ig-like domain-containing protein [Pseudonocardiaceae bacterium]
MRKNRFLTRVSSGFLVVAVAAGGALLIGGVSNATPRASTPVITVPTAATATSTTLTTAPASPVAQGTKVTLTATVTPTTATGTIQFKDGEANLGNPVTVANGKASGTTSTLTVGSHQLTAVFTPTNPALFSPSTSPAVTFVVTGPAAATATSTALTTAPASPVAQGSTVTLTATVTPTTATGTVQFKDGTTNIGNPVPVTNGKASGTTSTLTAGSHQLTAVFAPTDPAAFGPSTSPAVTFVVNGAGAATTSTALTTSPASPVAQGNPVTLTATVAPSTAAGTVQFKDGTTNIGNPVNITNGTASTTTSTLTVGDHSLTAEFTPSNAANFSPSTSPAVTFVITAPIVAKTTTTTLTVFPSFPVPQGVPVLLKATVVPDNAAGTIQFQDGTTALGAPVPVVLGSAVLITPALTPGTHSLTAVFTPADPAAYAPSTSPAESLTVTEPVGSALLERILIEVQEIIESVLDGDRSDPDRPVLR